MSNSPFPMEKKRLLGLVAVLSFGLTSLFAVLSLGELVAPTFVLGFFVVLPLIALLGDDLSIVESGDEAVAEDAATDARDPVERLRDRYAAGEIGEDEFERKLERLIETEDLQRTASRRDRTSDGTASERDRSVELE